VKQCSTDGLVRCQVGFQDGEEVVVGVALMQEQRLAAFHRQLQLALERAARGGLIPLPSRFPQTRH